MFVNIVIRAYYMRRLFPEFQVLRQFLRAAAPVLPAVAAVLLARALLPLDRSVALAAAELVLYGVVTAALTVAFERALVLEVVGYLRRRAKGVAVA
jgi:hypothetical protein